MIQVQHLGQLRVQRTEVANQHAITLDPSSLPRVQGRMLARHETEGLWCAGITQQRFHIGFRVEEVDAVATIGPAFRLAAAAEDASEHGLLLETFELADKTQATLEQTYARLLAVQVVLQRLDQARPQRRTHRSHVRGNRIGQQQRLDARVEQFEQPGIDEAVGDRFLVTTCHQQATKTRQFGLGLGLGVRSQARLRVAHRQTVVAVQASQLLDQVDFQGNIEAMTGHTDLPESFAISLDVELQGGEQTFDLRRVHVHAEHLLDALGTQGDGSYLRQIGHTHLLNYRAGFAADDFQQ
ncbi:hypothetical protein D3C78_1194010 [compost metagenome]